MPIITRKEFHCPVCNAISPLYDTNTYSDIVCPACGSVFDSTGEHFIRDSDIRGYNYYREFKEGIY